MKNDTRGNRKKKKIEIILYLFQQFNQKLSTLL